MMRQVSYNRAVVVRTSSNKTCINVFDWRAESGDLVSSTLALPRAILHLSTARGPLIEIRTVLRSSLNRTTVPHCRVIAVMKL